MSYVAPLSDIRFTLSALSGLDGVLALPAFAGFDAEAVDAILTEAARFAETTLAPLNQSGDHAGARWRDGAVETPPGWREAYARLVEGGWCCPAADAEHGGMGLPWLVNAAVQEMFEGANMAFQLCPLLTQGAVEALSLYGDEALKAAWLPKLVSGDWTGTMNLTEPQAGSDLSAVRALARPDGDHFRIRGQKIYITYGEHDLTDNILHLVLARLPDAPEGVKGISLFLVPKVLADGTRNDVRCVSIERKLGIHASPTCTLSFGDDGGAVGWLVGAPNRGLEHMFAMMNNARLAVGLQGVGIAERACQKALGYARERRQGRADGFNGPAPLVAHPDVRRMLGLMRVRTDAARALAYEAAAALDRALHAPDAAARARSQRRVDLLIPVVKGWATEMAVATADLGVQVHGGMGYVEDGGAAQLLRDARISTIYEGTTGIQALDLVGRKIIRDRGAAARELIAELRECAARLEGRDVAGAQWGALRAAVGEGADMLYRAVDWLVVSAADAPERPAAAAVNILHLFGLVLGAWKLVDGADRAERLGRADAPDRLRAAAFYCAQVFPETRARRDAALAGSDAVLALSDAALG